MSVQPDFSFAPPPPPDPVQVSQWAAQAHLLLAALAGAGVVGAGWTAVSVEQIGYYITFGLTAVSLISAAVASIKVWRAKVASAKAAREGAVDAAVASAKATVATGVATPVTVAVVEATPPGIPNVGVAQRIGGAEIALATTTQNIPTPPPVTPGP